MAAERHEITHEEHIEPTPLTHAPGPSVASEHVESVVDTPTTRHMQVYRLQQAIYLFFGVLEVLIAIRFLLRLFGANPNAPFTSAIAAITAPFIAPFVGVFGNVQASGSLFEPASILAIVIYALLAWLIAKMVWLLFARDDSTVASTRVRTRSDTELPGGSRAA
jgi:YggT family protein